MRKKRSRGQNHSSFVTHDLPQRRVRSSRGRAIPYPSDHPLARHLQLRRQRDRRNSNETHSISESEVNGNSTTNSTSKPSASSYLLSSSVSPSFLPSSSPFGPLSTNLSTGHIEDFNSTDAPSSYEPIRIKAFFMEAHEPQQGQIQDIAAPLSPPPLNQTLYHETVLYQEIIEPSLNTWSQALHTVPVLHNLTLDVSQLYDGVSCGPGIDVADVYPTVVVPEEHLDWGVEESDLVVYVVLGVRDGGDQEEEPDLPVWVDGKEEEVDDDFMSYGGRRQQKMEDGKSKSQRDDRQQNLNESSSGQGVNLTKTILSSGSFKLTKHCRRTTYLASATHCSTDQFDRPVWGLLHLCLDISSLVQLLSPTPSDEQGSQQIHDKTIRTIRTAVQHELAHILGFNSQSMAHFRNPYDGTPITPRDSYGDVRDISVECTGPSSLSRRYATIPLPSEKILKFRTVRGGVRVAEVSSPTVRRVVRNFFGCQSLMGAELDSAIGELVHPRSLLDDKEDERLALPNNNNEEDESLVSSCIGDHWSRRLFRTDIMNPILNTHDDSTPFTTRISSLTLAFFNDTGWYRINANRAWYGTEWGRGAGCGFVNESCVGPTKEETNKNQDGDSPGLESSGGWVKEKNSQFFCGLDYVVNGSDDEDDNYQDDPTTTLPPPENVEDIISEARKRRKKSNRKEDSEAYHSLQCTPDMTRKATCNIRQYQYDLPSEYQYFSDTLGKNFGGSDPYLDYCPVPVGYSNGKCQQPLPPITGGATNTYKDETTPPQQIITDLTEMYGQNNSRCLEARISDEHTSICVPIACVISDRTLRVKFDGRWQICHRRGQVIYDRWDLPDRRRLYLCPDPVRMCPTFYCPRDCLDLEGAICDYTTGRCLCPNGNHTRKRATFSARYPEAAKPPILIDGLPHSVCDKLDHFNPHLSTATSPSDNEPPCPDYHPIPIDHFRNPRTELESSLSEYYFLNETLLVDDPHSPIALLFKIFAQMNAGEVIGFVTTLMVAFVTLCIIHDAVVVRVRRRKKRKDEKRAAKAGFFRGSVERRNHSGASHQRSTTNRRRRGRTNHSTLPISIFSPSSRNTNNVNIFSPRRHSRHDNEDNLDSQQDSPPPTTRSHRRSNSNKDKVIASMLVDLRINDPRTIERLRRQRLQRRMRERVEQWSKVQRELNIAQHHNEGSEGATGVASRTSDGRRIVRSTELPPLPGNGLGRVWGVVGAHFINDEDDLVGDNNDENSLGHFTQSTSSTLAPTSTTATTIAQSSLFAPGTSGEFTSSSINMTHTLLSATNNTTTINEVNGLSSCVTNVSELDDDLTYAEDDHLHEDKSDENDHWDAIDYNNAKCNNNSIHSHETECEADSIGAAVEQSDEDRNFDLEDSCIFSQMVRRRKGRNTVLSNLKDEADDVSMCG